MILRDSMKVDLRALNVYKANIVSLTFSPRKELIMYGLFLVNSNLLMEASEQYCF